MGPVSSLGDAPEVAGVVRRLRVLRHGEVGPLADRHRLLRERVDGRYDDTAELKRHYVFDAQVVNIARAVDELKAAGVWTIGLAGESETTYTDVDLAGPCAIVLGVDGDFHVCPKCGHGWPDKRITASQA